MGWAFPSAREPASTSDALTDVPRRYVIGLGANLGDRLHTLESAVMALRRVGAVQAVSAVYETAPVGPAQPDYLNAAVLLESTLEPAALLRELLAIERAHGRRRQERWGPRTLDLDLLCAGDLMLSEPGLTLPHPELVHRAFALRPLLDVAPEARDPSSQLPYVELLARLPVGDVRRLETPPSWGRPDSLDSLQAERNTERP
jgi:2-amino-4-hydroxy-6-hydroxymethyldihydropteridine diphosphokinase